MLLVKLITPKKINKLYLKPTALSAVFIAFLTAFQGLAAHAQDNSPYSRYGIGDLVPATNISSRAMGGISAGYIDPFALSVNFANPASYAFFVSYKEPKSNKLTSGRAVLDLGVNLENRTLREPNNPEKFTANNLLFSHMQIGIPLSSKWGMSFGLRPVSRISYKIYNIERLINPVTGNSIDSAYTEYTGDGGAFLPSLGIARKFIINSKNTLALGLNAGYLFGRNDYSTRRSFLNDTVEYYRGNYETRTNYGNFYFTGGAQYRVLVKNKDEDARFLTVGAYGSWGQQFNARQDLIRETYYVDDNFGNTTLDSVYNQTGVKGKIQYPSSLTVGFVYEKGANPKRGSWLFGMDFSQQSWDQFRFYGQKESLRNKWELHMGGELRPQPRRSYFSNVVYRAGLYFGPDYIAVPNKLPQFGASFGMGLPLVGSGQARTQVTAINIALEYGKRGNDNNVLRENLFRLSIGFALGDIWFVKRKYD